MFEKIFFRHIGYLFTIPTLSLSTSYLCCHLVLVTVTFD